MKTLAVKNTALVLCLVFSVTSSGCTRLEPSQFDEYGYKGEAVVKEGKRIVPIDWLGNLFGVLNKIILWNWKVHRHNIQEDTEQAVAAYIKDNAAILGNVAVQLNRYAPQDSWRRLFANKGVKWPYKYTLGFLSVLIFDTILIDRIFAGLVSGDRYNPYTHTVHIHSDLPSIALHELGHAKDFGERRYRGSYALLYVVPGAPLYHEFQASADTFEYLDEKDLTETRIEAYKILFPAYATYAGSIIGGPGFFAAVIAGHIWGRIKASRFERRIRR